MILAEGGPVTIGTQVIVRENAVIRSTPEHPVKIGDYVLIGPHTTLLGCTVEDQVFLATGVCVLHGSTIGRQAEVRINGVVHVRTVVERYGVVPIGWVAVGDPAEILPPNEHDRIWEIQKPLNFALTVYGLQRDPSGSVDMRELTGRLARGMKEHEDDEVIE